MNAQQLYLAWVRSQYPQVYTAALRVVTGKPRTLGGLDNDLLQQAIAPSINTFLGDDSTVFDTSGGTTTDFSSTPDAFSAGNTDPLQAVNLTPITFDPTSVQLSPSVSNTLAQQASSGTDVFSNIADAVAKVATTYIGASAQANLLSVNTQRARQGLPPLAANGRPVTSNMLAPTSASIAAMERAIAGAATPTNMMVIGGVLLLGFLVLGRKSR